MALPDFQTILLPFLKVLSGGEARHMSVVTVLIAKELDVTPEELDVQYPSGNGYVFANRVQFAKLHLKKAGLVRSPQRGEIQITDAGKEVLKSPPQKITVGYLQTIPEYAEFRNEMRRGGDEKVGNSSQELQQEQTPLELLESGYIQLKQSVAAELMELIMQASPRFFEKLVVDLLLKMGYGGSLKDAGRAIGQSGDGGVDGIIKEDALGLEAIYIQAKRWDGVVGRPEIQKFVGALAGRKANKGVFISTSRFTKDAIEYADSVVQKVVLVDGRMLTELMIEHGVGVAQVTAYSIKKADPDFFLEE